MKIKLREKIGKGYDQFWHFKGRYLAVKGSRGSKKSTTTAMKIIYMMMKYPLSNTIVLRQVFNTHRDSTWKQLKWATEHLGVEHLWNFTVSPLEATYIPTGQKIYFRGCDNPLSITSITAPVGFLTYMWVEEAYQIVNEDDFNKVDMSMRGELPEGYFKQVILTFNPWSEQTWLKKRFFDTPDDDNKLSMTTTYLCNEWLGEDDLKIFEEMKRNNPTRYMVEGEGAWGCDQQGLVYHNWIEQDFDPFTLASTGLEHRCGMDIGYIDPSAIVRCLYDKDNKTIYVFKEFYRKGCQLEDLEKAIKEVGVGKTQLFVDCADTRAIAYFRSKGINAVPCAKGKDSVKMGIMFLQDHKLVIHPSCQNVITELKNYSYVKSKQTGLYTEDTTHQYSHSLDSIRYAFSTIYTNTKMKTFNKTSLGL